MPALTDIILVNLKYTVQKFEEVSLEVSSISDDEDYTLSFRILERVSSEQSYMQATDKFKIEVYNNKKFVLN